MYKPSNEVLTNTPYRSRLAGYKQFELKDHLGNVRVVVSDRKRTAVENSTLSLYAQVVNQTDYYPFGMSMPNRTYTDPTSLAYRYGFNGKENDKDIGEGIQDYGMRIYDETVAKFLSVDPLSSSYPWYTPYQFAGNTPIQAIDLDGLEEYKVTILSPYNSRKINAALGKNNAKEVIETLNELIWGQFRTFPNNWWKGVAIDFAKRGDKHAKYILDAGLKNNKTAKLFVNHNKKKSLFIFAGYDYTETPDKKNVTDITITLIEKTLPLDFSFAPYAIDEATKKLVESINERIKSEQKITNEDIFDLAWNGTALGLSIWATVETAGVSAFTIGSIGVLNNFDGFAGSLFKILKKMDGNYNPAESETLLGNIDKAFGLPDGLSNALINAAGGVNGMGDLIKSSDPRKWSAILETTFSNLSTVKDGKKIIESINKPKE
jgi:RHS repeat-associated protein